MLTGRVLITGGAGYLGRGILRKAERENWNAEFTVYSRDETKQFEAKRKYPHARFVLGDILDVERLALVAHNYDTIIHAAAVKYIPEGEFNVNECIRVNVDGSRCVLAAAKEADVKEVIMISTDKAVEPINAYGMTKALMERLIGEAAVLNAYSGRKYVAVRYGNVIGSTGSIVPVFERSLRETGEIRITDPNMTRFWISVDDAVNLIERALDSDVSNGSVVIPTPRASHIIDVADAVSQLANSESRSYSYTGKRPGEKMHEELISDSERVRTYKLDSDYYELMPPGHELSVVDVDGKPADSTIPRLSSDTAEKISSEELVEMIQDARNV